jgi:hypothetical protein
LSCSESSAIALPSSGAASVVVTTSFMLTSPLRASLAAG